MKDTRVVNTADRLPSRAISPLHAALLAGSVPLFLGGLLSDAAYFSNYQVQWSNFAAWLIAGAMVFTGFALLWLVLGLFKQEGRRGWRLLCLLLLLATFVLGFVNSFVHARDAYGTMPDGLVLSAIVTALAFAATWVGFSSLRGGVVK